MTTIFKAVMASVVMWCAAASAQEYEPGKPVPDIQCKRSPEYSYILYLPKNYDPAREDKWPVLFLMSPSGGNLADLQRYVPGAERCSWILAMSMQSKNENDGTVSHNAIMAMVDDVFARFPVNKKRCYASGFSGGARETFWLANRRQDSIAGIIPCGAGDAGNPVNGNVKAYGISGTACFNRWDMTITFKQRIKDQGVLRFILERHKWPGAPYILDAMLWLNGQYFERKGDETELTSFSAGLLADVKENKDKNPVLAYERCQILADMKKAPDAKEGALLLAELTENPAVQTHVRAMKDISEFAGKHFNTDVFDYINKRTTPAAERDSEKLAVKYKDTPYEELMRDLGRATKEQRK